MDTILKTMFKSATLTPGRRILALRRVKKVAQTRNLIHMVTHIDKAIEHDLETRRLDNRWREKRDGAGAGPSLTALHTLVEKLLAGIRDVAELHRLGASDAVAVEVERFIDKIFPAGVHAITTLPTVEQAAELERILALVRGPLAPRVADFGLGRVIERLARASEDYRSALHARDPLDFATVCDARDQGQIHLLEIIAMIVGAYPLANDPEHEAARRALLAPIIEQDKAVRACRCHHPTVPDVDPDSGELDAAGPEPGHASPARLRQSA